MAKKPLESRLRKEPVKSLEWVAEHWRELHEELWTWLAESGNATKRGWSRWEANGGDIPRAINHCFACQSCDWNCALCPVDWNSNNTNIECKCEGEGSAYKIWMESECDEVDVRKNAARIIAGISAKNPLFDCRGVVATVGCKVVFTDSHAMLKTGTISQVGKTSVAIDQDVKYGGDITIRMQPEGFCILTN